MVKVLIYSSKELYDNASYVGRADAHVIAYREDEYDYRIVKNRTLQYMGEKISHYRLKQVIEWAELDEWTRDKEAYETAEKYKTHPFTTLMKNG